MAVRTVTVGLRQRAWWVLRRQKTATVPMLLSAITDGTQKSAGSNLSRYLKALERAGIVTRQAQRVPGKRSTFGAIRYCLVRNTGRMAPVYRITAGEVFDPNTGEVFRLEAGEATL